VQPREEDVEPPASLPEQGSVLGAAALVAGTAIGAGILALPAVTRVSGGRVGTSVYGGRVRQLNESLSVLSAPTPSQDAGFGPSAATLAALYLFSVTSGLLLAEVNINTQSELGGGAVSLQV